MTPDRQWRLSQVPWDEVPWPALDTCPDRVVFQTREWLEFIAETQRGRPVVAQVLHGDVPVGWFSGVRVRRAGIPILGGSFPGWTTPYMGFNFPHGGDRLAALGALRRFAFRDLGCWHIEVSDRRFPTDVTVAGYVRTDFRTLQTDLTQDEQDLFMRLDTDTRRRIRRAREKGVVITTEVGSSFAEEYYAQLEDVFAKQGLPPTYGVDRVHALLRLVGPTGHLLLLRALAPDGTCLATGIYPGSGQLAEFWGNASWRASQHYSPNELMHWEAMMIWKARGAALFDWGGWARYKLKYGGEPVSIPWLAASRFPILNRARDLARGAFGLRQRLLGSLRRRFPRPHRVGPSGNEA